MKTAMTNLGIQFLTQLFASLKCYLLLCVCLALTGCSHILPAQPNSTQTVAQTAPTSETSTPIHSEPTHPLTNTESPAPLPELAKIQPTKKIAVLLPTSGKLSSTARLILDGFLAARSDAQQQGEEAIPEIQTYDTENMSVVELYNKAVAQGAELIIGPLEKEQVTQLYALHHFPIPILALNYVNETTASSTPSTQPMIAHRTKDTDGFYQFGLAAEDEAAQIADQALLDGHQSAALIYPDTEWGKRIIQSFVKRWRSQGGQLATTLAFSDNPEKLAPAIKKMLSLKQTPQIIQGVKPLPQHRTDIDFIFLLATPNQARQIKPILNFYYAANIPVYATSHIYVGNKNPLQDRDLDGILFVDQPWILTDDDPLKIQAQALWPNQSGQSARLRAFGIDAYRLQNQLKLLLKTPHMSLAGATGQLTLDRHSLKIHRRLSWAHIKNGLAESMTDDTVNSGFLNSNP